MILMPLLQFLDNSKKRMRSGVEGVAILEPSSGVPTSAVDSALN